MKILAGILRSIRAWPTAACWGSYQLCHLLVAHFTSRNVIEPRLGHMVSAVSSVVLLTALGALLDRSASPRVRALVGAFGLALNVVATDYLVIAHTTFDLNVTLANWHLMTSVAAFATVFDGLLTPVCLWLTAACFIVGVLYVVLALRSQTHRTSSRRATLIAAVVALASFLPARGYSELGNVLWSSVLDLSKAEAASLQPGQYPLLRTNAANAAGAPAEPKRVPVILLMVESFNARFLGQKRNGKPILPVLERHLQDGLHVRRFYGNSIQTSLGQFATLMGVPPLAKGSLFQAYRETRLLGLPQVLANAGYQTAFLQAYPKIDFEGTGDFMRAQGFAVVESPVKAGPEDAPFVWGWGPEDRLLYRDGFRRLDELHAHDSAPIFATMATISSHMRFRVPPERRTLYPEPVTQEERYLNAIHLVDEQLEDFFSEVKKRPWLNDALIVITGDHSFPTGQHGVEFNEVGYYEESFRIPFLMVWPGHLAPRVVDDFEASQVDIAPTILDAMGLLPKEHHFYGQSILSAEPRRPVPLVQPYNGEYLGVVRNGLKYLRRSRTGEEIAFDLRRDPDERQNVLRGSHGSVNPEAIQELKAATANLEVVRAALQSNAVWPADGSRASARSSLTRGNDAPHGRTH